MLLGVTIFDPDRIIQDKSKFAMLRFFTILLTGIYLCSCNSVATPVPLADECKVAAKQLWKSGISVKEIEASKTRSVFAKPAFLWDTKFALW